MEKRGTEEVRYDTVCIHKENLTTIIPQVLVEHEMVDSQQGA